MQRLTMIFSTLCLGRSANPDLGPDQKEMRPLSAVALLPPPRWNSTFGFMWLSLIFLFFMLTVAQTFFTRMVSVLGRRCLIAGSLARLISCSLRRGKDSQIRMWDLRTRRCKVIFTGHSKAVTCLTALREDGSSLILSGAEVLLTVCKVCAFASDLNSFVRKRKCCMYAVVL